MAKNCCFKSILINREAKYMIHSHFWSANILCYPCASMHHRFLRELNIFIFSCFLAIILHANVHFCLVLYISPVICGVFPRKWYCSCWHQCFHASAALEALMVIKAHWNEPFLLLLLLKRLLHPTAPQSLVPLLLPS